MHLAPAHAAHGLGQGREKAGQFAFRRATQDGQFRPETLQNLGVHIADLAAFGTGAENFPQHLGQGHQRGKATFAQTFAPLAVAGSVKGLVAVRQLHHPVKHAHGKRPAAHRADAAQFAGLGRAEHDVALAVPVHVVFALFRKKFDSAEKARLLRLFRVLQGLEHTLVADGAGKNVGLAAQVLARVGVGIGNQPVVVQGAPQAVHGRIGRQAGFQGENLPGQIAKAVFHSVKAGLGPEQGKPGGPNVRRHEKGQGVGLEHQLQQIARIQAKDGAAVGMQIAELGQALAEAFRRLKGGHEHQVVHFAHPAAALVNGADLALEHETRPGRIAPLARLIHGRHRQFGQSSGNGSRILEAVKAARLLIHQLLSQFFAPLRVGEVAAAQHIQAFESGPGRQQRHVQPRTGGPGKTRMNVQIRQKVSHIGAIRTWGLWNKEQPNSSRKHCV